MSPLRNIKMYLRSEKCARVWSWVVTFGLLVAATVGIVSACFAGGTPEAHAHLFTIAVFGFGFLSIVVPIDRFPYRLGRASFSAIYFLVVYRVFVGYMNRPWFAVEDRVRDDGPSFGWYTFEFEPPYVYLLIVAAGGILLGVLVLAAFRQSLAISGLVWRNSRCK